MSINRMDTLVRQADLIPLKKLAQRVSIIGAGATGSVISLTLAKIGFTNQEVWDADDVDVVNMNNQMYALEHIGKPKVEALSHLYKMFAGVTPITHAAMFDANTFVSGVVISALDSMDGRKMVYEQAKKCRCRWLIDPRMSIQYGLIYNVDLECAASCDEYEKTLYSDADAVQERCTMKSTMFTSNIIGGIVVKVVKDLVVDGGSFKTMIYDIENNDSMFMGRIGSETSKE